MFFDSSGIADMEDWRRKILRGLRTSKLFLAFVSPNYLASPYCLREWEEYLRHEHTQARGDDGVAPIYFVTVPELHEGPGQVGAAPAVAAWVEDLKRRQAGTNLDLRPWFEGGPELLRELDAAERVQALRNAPRPSDGDRHIIELASRIEALDRRISRRLDQITLAELAPGKLERSYGHFVGRHAELRRLHEALIAERVGS